MANKMNYNIRVHRKGNAAHVGLVRRGGGRPRRTVSSYAFTFKDQQDFDKQLQKWLDKVIAT